MLLPDACLCIALGTAVVYARPFCIGARERKGRALLVSACALRNRKSTGEKRTTTQMQMGCSEIGLEDKHTKGQRC